MQEDVAIVHRNQRVGFRKKTKMKDNLNLKCGLITQSLSPAFVLLGIRHFHLNYPMLCTSFIEEWKNSPINAIQAAFFHPRLGELLIFLAAIAVIITSILSVPAFKATQIASFESHGERVKVVEEKKDAAASFLMTFILPLLIDELSTPQNWISYVLVIVVVYAVLYQSNLYYQSPVLAFLGYKIFTFKVINPECSAGMEPEKEYIGITKRKMITCEASIVWRYISDDVFLVYNEF